MSKTKKKMNEVTILQVKTHSSSLKEFDCIIQTDIKNENRLPEILSQVQHIAGNLSKLNLLKALILLV